MRKFLLRIVQVLVIALAVALFAGFSLLLTASLLGRLVVAIAAGWSVLKVLLGIEDQEVRELRKERMRTYDRLCQLQTELQATKWELARKEKWIQEVRARAAHYPASLWGK